jgi:putative transposase
VVDITFRQLYAFFIVEHHSRRVVHVGVTCHPTDAWLAQQLREATPFGEHPTYLIRDNDSKFGSPFSHVTASTGITILKTPFHAPKANAICERFLESVRRECLEHFLIFGEFHLHRVLREYVAYFNLDRPHQGTSQHIPVSRRPDRHSKSNAVPIQSVPILHRLHHRYQRVA